MKTNDKGEIILTRRMGAEIFLILSNVRLKLKGKIKTSAEKYWKDFEKALELSTEEKIGETQ